MKRKNVKNYSLVMASACAFLSSNLWAKDIKISGDLMIDHDNVESGFMENSDKSQSSSEIRRARLGVKTQLNDDWKAKLKLSFSDDDTEVKDAYLQYKGFDWGDITIGKQKEGFGLEKFLGSRDALMIERSLVTTALAPSRSLGVSFAGGASSYNWHLGYYQPEDKDNVSAITGRAAWLPWHQENELVHLGLAFSERDLDGTEYRINETLEVHTADSLFEGEKLLADKESLQGVEFLWQQSGFTTLAEWQQSTVTDVNNMEFDYHGGYVQLGYQLSGDNRSYKKGKIGAVSTPGWEVTSRYSQFKLAEEDCEAKIYAIGLNYTVNNHVKFMADYIKAKQFEAGSEVDSSDGISLRAQYSF